MKKYVKPKVFFENFEISQQIAACDFDSNNTSNDESCIFTGVIKEWEELGETKIFMEGCGSGDSIKVEGYCYHNNVSSEYGIFNS